MDTKKLMHLLGFLGALAAAVSAHAGLFPEWIAKYAEFAGTVTALALAWLARQPGNPAPDPFGKVEPRP